MAKRLAVFAYGLVSYMLFFRVCHRVHWQFDVPKSMDSAARMSFLPALVINALLLLTFALQHSDDWEGLILTSTRPIGALHSAIG